MKWGFLYREYPTFSNIFNYIDYCSYDTEIPHMAAVGGNTIRIWLSPDADVGLLN